MTTQTTTPATPATPTGRDEKGRFTEGNTFGRGNPHARQVADLRKALMQVISPAEMTILAQTTLAYAMKGNMAAAKLLFQYCLGTPLAGLNPDLIDRDELACLTAKVVTVEEMEAASGRKGFPIHMAIPLVKGTQYATAQELTGQARDHFAAADARRAEQAQAADEDGCDDADEGDEGDEGGDADPLPLPGGQRSGRAAQAANRGQSVPAPERRSTPMSDEHDPR